MNTKDVGNVGESAIIAEFVYYGIPVYLPFGDNLSCDLIADFDGKLQRVQVKTCSSIRDGKMTFSLGSRRYNRDHVYNELEVDYFALYCIENRTAYLLMNIEGLNDTGINLRTEPARNGQVKGIRFAEDYLFNRKFNVMGVG